MYLRQVRYEMQPIISASLTMAEVQSIFDLGGINRFRVQQYGPQRCEWCSPCHPSICWPRQVETFRSHVRVSIRCFKFPKFWYSHVAVGSHSHFSCSYFQCTSLDYSLNLQHCLTSIQPQLVSSSTWIRDFHFILDDDLKYKLAYAWSLPSNNRFIERMNSIQDAVNHMLPAAQFLNSRIYYLIRQIRQVVMVSSS